MVGKLVYDVATLVSETASEKIEQYVGEGDDPQITYRASLLLALVAAESEKSTTKEELLAYLDRLYDLVHEAPPAPAVAQSRTKSAEFKLQLKLN